MIRAHLRLNSLTPFLVRFYAYSVYFLFLLDVPAFLPDYYPTFSHTGPHYVFFFGWNGRARLFCRLGAFRIWMPYNIALPLVVPVPLATHPTVPRACLAARLWIAPAAPPALDLVGARRCCRCTRVILLFAPFTRFTFVYSIVTGWDDIWISLSLGHASLLSISSLLGFCTRCVVAVGGALRVAFAYILPVTFTGSACVYLRSYPRVTCACLCAFLPVACR